MSKLANLIRRVGRQVLVLLIAIIVIFVPVPLFICLIVPSFILRTFVKIIARIFRPDLAQIFRGKGIYFALESIYTRPKLSIQLHFVFDGHIPLDKLRLLFQQRILNHCDKHGNLEYAPLRQTWTQFLGFIFWKWDKNFSLNHHIRVYDHKEQNLALPEVCTEEDLKRVTGDLISKPFAQGRSPWEIMIIPKYRASNNDTGKDQMVIVFRIHHAMADGYSILKMMLKLFNMEGSKVPRPNFPTLSTWQKIVRAFVFPLRLPFDIASQFIVDSVDGTNCWHLLDTKLTRQYHSFFSDQVPVDRIKEIKNKYGIGYNAAVYAVAVGGIRRLMQEAGQKLPKSLSCFVPFPLPKHPGGLVVHVSGFFFTMSPRIHSPVERMLEISRNMQVLQDAPAVPIVSSISLDCVSVLPVCILRLLYNKMMMTLAMTSFPGPEEQLDIMGTAKLVDIIPSLGHMPGNMGAAGVLVSLGGKQRIVLTVDKAIFEGYDVPTDFGKHVNDEVNALLYPTGKEVVEEV